MISKLLILGTCVLSVVLAASESHSGRQNYRVGFIRNSNYLDSFFQVKGAFRCGNVPVKNVQVKLIDDDFGSDPDDDLGSGYTNANGEFELSGSTTELTTIDPHLKIYHDCDDGINVSF